MGMSVREVDRHYPEERTTSDKMRVRQEHALLPRAAGLSGPLAEQGCQVMNFIRQLREVGDVKHAA